MRQSIRKKFLKKKDGERHLHFSSCPPDVQAALRETRRAECNKWIKFNAGVILTDEEVRQLTDAHLRRDNDYVFGEKVENNTSQIPPIIRVTC